MLSCTAPLPLHTSPNRQVRKKEKNKKKKRHNGGERSVVNRYAAPGGSFVAKGRAGEESENNKGVKERATEAATSPLSVPNEEKACGDHYQEASLTSCGRGEEPRGRTGETEGGISENKLPPIQYSWIKSRLPFTLIFFHYV